VIISQKKALKQKSTDLSGGIKTAFMLVWVLHSVEKGKKGHPSRQPFSWDSALYASSATAIRRLPAAGT
jgi:hypothetical protein